MGRFAVFMAVFGLFATSIISVPVVAQQSEVTDGDVQQAPETDDPDTETDRAERIKKYKNRAEQPTDVVKARKITNVCRSAGGKITSARARHEAVIRTRVSTYQTVVGRLDRLERKLQTAEIQPSTQESIATANTEFQQRTADAIIVLQEYGQILDDIIAMDCEADPEAFHAALQAARLEMRSARQESSDVKSYAQDTIKNLLQGLRAELATNEASLESEQQDEQSDPGSGSELDQEQTQ